MEKNNRPGLLHSPRHGIPIGEPVVTLDGKPAVRFKHKRGNASIYEIITLAELDEMIKAVCYTKDYQKTE